MSRTQGALCWLGLCFWSIATVNQGLRSHRAKMTIGGIFAVMAVVALVRIQNRTTPRARGSWPLASMLGLVGVGMAAASVFSLAAELHKPAPDLELQVAGYGLFSIGMMLAVAGGYSAWIWSGPRPSESPPQP